MAYFFRKNGGIFSHAKDCKQGFDSKNVRTIKIEEKKFDRKVWEALGIYFRETSLHSEHGLNQDDGQYVTTQF